MKQKRKPNWLVILLTLAAIAFAITACVLCIHKTQENRETSEQVASMNEAVTEEESSSMNSSNQEESSVDTESITTESVSSESGDDTAVSSESIIDSNYTPPHQELFEENSDMVAWLKIDGTTIDYPVMQTPEDENYYLRRDFEGNSNSNGCLIMDTDSDVSTPGTNLIIHGHNMRSGAMFGTLNSYEDSSFFTEHQYITLETKSEIHTYQVMAVFRSQIYKKSQVNVFKYYQFFEATNEEEFDDFYNNVMQLALYDTGVTASYGDHLITLSTCAYHVEMGRFVVVAKEITEEIN